MVLPFRQEGVLDEHEQEGAFTGRYSVYVVGQNEIQVKMKFLCSLP